MPGVVYLHQADCGYSTEARQLDEAASTAANESDCAQASGGTPGRTAATKDPSAPEKPAKDLGACRRGGLRCHGAGRGLDVRVQAHADCHGEAPDRRALLEGAAGAAGGDQDAA